MNRQISLQQYRTIDLSLLAVLLVASQVMIRFALTFWPEQLYIVSPVAAMVALVMMRWSGYGAIHAVVGGIAFTVLSGGSWEHAVIYGVGNLAAMLALVMFRIFGKERIRKDGFLSLMFALLVQLLMQLGRAGIAALLGHSGAACLGFITTDILSELFTLFVIWIARRIEGLFEDQKNYLLRIQSEH